jgi:hypothetical protein
MLSPLDPVWLDASFLEPPPERLPLSPDAGPPLGGIGALADVRDSAIDHSLR